RRAELIAPVLRRLIIQERRQPDTRTNSRPEPLPEPQKPRSKALKAPRRPPSQQLAQDQRQVEAGHMDQQPFEDVLVFSEMCPPHPAGVIAMGEAPFDQFAALA